jgi:hypothetical protein
LGGKVPGMRIFCDGCDDKTLPVKSKLALIRHSLYFSRESLTWGGGVAFLDPKPTQDENQFTIGRMYLVTEDQFHGIVAQENGLFNKTALFEIEDIKKSIKKKVSQGWYDTVMYLGEDEGYPILTFTNEKEFERVKINAPKESYLKVIITGLKQLGFEDENISKYLRKYLKISQNI